MVLPRICRCGAAFGGDYRKDSATSPARSASLRATRVVKGKPIRGRQSGSGWKTQVKSVLQPFLAIPGRGPQIVTFRKTEPAPNASTESFPGSLLLGPPCFGPNLTPKRVKFEAPSAFSFDRERPFSFRRNRKENGGFIPRAAKQRTPPSRPVGRLPPSPPAGGHRNFPSCNPPGIMLYSLLDRCHLPVQAPGSRCSFGSIR